VSVIDGCGVEDTAFIRNTGGQWWWTGAVKTWTGNWTTCSPVTPCKSDGWGPYHIEDNNKMWAFGALTGNCVYANFQWVPDGGNFVYPKQIPQCAEGSNIYDCFDWYCAQKGCTTDCVAECGVENAACAIGGIYYMTWGCP
jgi:hypothetical protein